MNRDNWHGRRMSDRWGTTDRFFILRTLPTWSSRAKCVREEITIMTNALSLVQINHIRTVSVSSDLLEIAATSYFQMCKWQFLKVLFREPNMQLAYATHIGILRLAYLKANTLNSFFGILTTSLTISTRIWSSLYQLCPVHRK